MRLPHFGRAALPIVALLCTAGVAAAQVPASTFEDLRFATGVGRVVTVTAGSGEPLTGRLTALTPERLALLVDGRELAFDRRVVRLIQAREADPLGNGMAIGALSAGLPVLLVTIRWCPLCFQAAASYALIGAGIGALVDGAVKTQRTLYLPPAPGGATGPSAAPILSTGRAGLAVSFGF